MRTLKSKTKIKRPKVFNLFIMKMTEPNTAWLQIGEPAITSSQPFTGSELKVFWKEFVFLECIKDEQGVKS